MGVGASGPYLDHQSLDAAADALLSRNGTVVVALTDAATRVPLPTDDRFAGTAVLPGERETVVDFVIPVDRMIVIGTWEGAQTIGLAQGTVCLSSEPSRPVTLTIVDARHRFGVWLAFLIPDDRWDTTIDVPRPIDPGLLVPARPRTATLHKNLYAVITHVDERVERMLGWTAAEMLGHRSLEFIHPDDHERAIGQWLEMRARRQTKRVRVRHRLRDGTWLWVEMENRFVGLDDPARLMAVCELSDISDEMAAYETVRHHEKLFRRLAESLPEGLFLVGVDQEIIYANARLASILGVSDTTSLSAQLATLAPDDRQRLLVAMAAAVDDRIDRTLEVEVLCPETGALRWCLATVTALSDEEGSPGAMVTLTDITESAMLREELRHRATYDYLTGCLNRASTFAALQRIVDAEHQQAAVLFVDLDHFKVVNDSFGHQVGDDLLAETARTIASHAGADDVLGRIGGDEFLLICHGLSSPQEALAAAHRLRRILDRTVLIAGRAVRMSASIGVTIATVGASVQSVVMRADEAMYQSKRQRDRHPVFMNTQACPASTGRIVPTPTGTTAAMPNAASFRERRLPRETPRSRPADGAGSS